MEDKEPVVLNEKNVNLDKSLVCDEIVKKLRVSITTLKGTHMSADGAKVDYSQIATSPKFEDYCNIAALLKYIDPTLLSEDQRKAFFINIYNSLTVHAMVHQAKTGTLPDSPKEVPGFWKLHCYQIGESIYTLDEIEHGVLRANKGHPAAGREEFGQADPRLKVALKTLDPRIHFALNCGALSCPPIRIYTGDKIDSQLQQATQSFLTQEVNIARNGEKQFEVVMSKLFLWYGADFGSNHTEMLEWVAKHLGDSNDAVLEALRGQFTVTFKDYDWASNLLGEPEGK